MRNDPVVIEELRSLKNETPVTYDQGVEKAAEIGAVKYFEVSAKENDGIKELFEYAAKIAIYPKARLAKCKMI